MNTDNKDQWDIYNPLRIELEKSWSRCCFCGALNGLFGRKLEEHKSRCRYVGSANFKEITRPNYFKYIQEDNQQFINRMHDSIDLPIVKNKIKFLEEEIHYKNITIIFLSFKAGKASVIQDESQTKLISLGSSAIKKMGYSPYILSLLNFEDKINDLKINLDLLPKKTGVIFTDFDLIVKEAAKNLTSTIFNYITDPSNVVIFIINSMDNMNLISKYTGNIMKIASNE